jgi:hypothetical protein
MARTVMRFLLFAVCTLPLSGGMAGCTSGVCTLIGCNSGLIVSVQPAPTPPYRIEAYTEPSATRYVADCATADSCGSGVVFTDFTPDRVSVDVITGADTVTREFTGPITYKTSQPNGPSCSPTCQSATIVFVR